MNDIDWPNTVYCSDTEQIPDGALTPRGNPVILTHHFDANCMHNFLDGKAITGCLHFVNKTPIMWYSKNQSTSETPTYRAKFSAAIGPVWTDY